MSMTNHTCTKCHQPAPPSACRFDGVQTDGKVPIALCYTHTCGGSYMVEIDPNMPVSGFAAIYGKDVAKATVQAYVGGAR